LRFAAALLVFFSHYGLPGVTGTALRMTQSGYAGVTLFFVLSGFVLTYKYLDDNQGGWTARKLAAYFTARIARVYPLYACFIAYGWLASGTPGVPWDHILAMQAWSADLGFVYRYNSAAWSVAVEVFLYLSFPLLVPLLVWVGAISSLRRLLVAAALVLLAMACIALFFELTGLNALEPQNPSSGHRWLYRTHATRLGDFLLGIFGAVYVMRFAGTGPTIIHRWGMVPWLATLSIALLLASRANYRSSFSWDVAYALPGILLIVGLAMNPRTLFSRSLASPALVLLGEASYAFYLVHLPAGPLRLGTVAGLPHELALHLIFLGLVISLSIGLHIALERPARRSLRQWLTPRPIPVPSPAKRLERTGWQAVKGAWSDS
jgi:peptidoglycan/LPS O-acetylase OafA/YrhL